MFLQGVKMREKRGWAGGRKGSRNLSASLQRVLINYTGHNNKENNCLLYIRCGKLGGQLAGQ